MQVEDELLLFMLEFFQGWHGPEQVANTQICWAATFEVDIHAAAPTAEGPRLLDSWSRS